MAALSSGPNRLGTLTNMPGIGGVSPSVPSSAAVERTAAKLGPGQEIGSLSAQFESGDNGPEVIGYDGKGGTSYGTYQISSRAGTMHSFLDYLSEKAPDIARQLQAAGPANTGSRFGKMPATWQKIAAQDPTRFSTLQNDFIEQTHYLPAMQEITEKTGFGFPKVQGHFRKCFGARQYSTARRERRKYSARQWIVPRRKTAASRCRN